MNEKIFAKVSEKDVTKSIVGEFAQEFLGLVDSEVIVVGAGPAGLMSALRLAEAEKKVVLIERNNYLGGGFWIGGFLMNKITLRHPAEQVLSELGVPFKETAEGLFVASGPFACSRLISAVCEAGVHILNMTKLEDVVLSTENEVRGVVINWTPVDALPRAITCVDPIALESRMVVDATGHDAVVLQKLQERGLFTAKGFGAMCVETSEDLVVNYTDEVYPGLVVCGMAVSTAFGLPRMGPTFGAMLLSGERAARVVIEKIAASITVR